MKITKYLISLSMVLVALTAGAAAPANYYSKVEGKSGTVNLLNALQQTVGSHTVVSYNGLLDLYKTSDVDANGKIWDMYSTKRWNFGNTCGNYSNVGDCYNREHSVPKSWFNDASPMYSDAFHLYPTDGKVNGQRGNYPYGECANGKNLGTYNGVKALGRLGTSTFSGYSGTVFEPDDEYKGDFARSYFYMAAAYYDRNKSWNSDMFSGDSKVFTTWTINLLMKWHRQDPVSQKERDRNEVVYGAQNNRNPFIDHPELAEYIWGDKVGEAWTSTASLNPAINQPLDGTTIDLGLTGVNTPLSRTITVKGTDLTKNVSVTVSSTDFTLSSSSLSYTAVNNGTASLTVTFKTSVAKSTSAVLTLTSGTTTSNVVLMAQAVDGIPALPAEDVEETSFTACWQYIGDGTYYNLNVEQDGRPVGGFPRQVNAAAGRFAVTNLDPETTYTYQLASATKSSNIITVTTLPYIPSIVVTNAEPLVIYGEPGETTDDIEVWFDVDNIDSDITVKVQSPFYLSVDKADWAQTITVSPEESRIYVRALAEYAGTYTSSLTFINNTYLSDDAEVTAIIQDAQAWFVETFETGADVGSYNSGSFKGSMGVWNTTDFGLWRSDNKYQGDYSGRFGKTKESSIATSEPKRDGIGTVSFFARSWSDSDGSLKIDVQYSADGNAWTTAGTVEIKDTDFKEYSVPVNVTGSNYLRLQQTYGARGNIDLLSVTDYKNFNGVDGVETDSYELWDAFSAGGELVIESSFETPQHFMVYTVDGAVMYSRELSSGQYRLRLSPGVYLVGCNDTARKVLVR